MRMRRKEERDGEMMRMEVEADEEGGGRGR